MASQLSEDCLLLPRSPRVSTWPPCVGPASPRPAPWKPISGEALACAPRGVLTGPDALCPLAAGGRLSVHSSSRPLEPPGRPPPGLWAAEGLPFRKEVTLGNASRFPGSREAWRSRRGGPGSRSARMRAGAWAPGRLSAPPSAARTPSVSSAPRAPGAPAASSLAAGVPELWLGPGGFSSAGAPVLSRPPAARPWEDVSSLPGGVDRKSVV